MPTSSTPHCGSASTGHRRRHAHRDRCRSTTPAGPPRHWSTTPTAGAGGQGRAEQVMARCDDVPDAAQRTLSTLSSPTDGAWSPWPADPRPDLATITAADECGLTLDGFLVSPTTRRRPPADRSRSWRRWASRSRSPPVTTRGRRKGMRRFGFGVQGHRHRCRDGTDG